MKRAGDEGGLFLCFTYDSLRMRYGLLMHRRGAWKERASEERAAIAFSALTWPGSSLAPSAVCREGDGPFPHLSRVRWNQSMHWCMY